MSCLKVMKPLHAFGSSSVDGKFKQGKDRRAQRKTESLQRECTYSTSLRLQACSLSGFFYIIRHNLFAQMYDGNPK